jgi:ABC-type amino acid transport system permease subunit
MNRFFSILVNYHAALANGIDTTVKLSAIIWTIGLVLGSIIGIAGARWRLLGMSARCVSFFLGSTPAIVILVWCYYPAQALLGVVIDPFITAAFALSLINVFIVADIVRPAIKNFPREMITAGYVYGLKSSKIFRYVTLPLLLRGLVPSLMFSQVAMLQATLFASLISVEEIFRVTQEINAMEYDPIILYTALAMLFLLVCAPINGIALALQRHFGRDISES